MSNMRVHHEMSPSRYPGLSACSGFDPAERETSDSSKGSQIHEQTQHALEHGSDPDESTARWFVGEIGVLAGDYPVVCEDRFSTKHFGGVFGYPDVHWNDETGAVHIADFKSFSDGTNDYLPQLRCYAAMVANGEDDILKCYLHVLHGGCRKVETVESTLGECFKETKLIYNSVKSGSGERRLCSWCKFCKHCSSCKETMNAVDVVSNNLPVFSKLSLPQKLVVLDAVDKLSASIREEAKAKARENDGYIEADGIRYEFKPHAGTPKLRDICELASEIERPELSDGRVFNGISQEELLKYCTVSKTKLIKRIKEENNKNKEIKKKEIEQYIESFYEKTEGTPHFVRVK